MSHIRKIVPTVPHATVTSQRKSGLVQMLQAKTLPHQLPTPTFAYGGIEAGSDATNMTVQIAAYLCRRTNSPWELRKPPIVTQEQLLYLRSDNCSSLCSNVR